MSEILTESFCERCGTRYTFESARPKIRLKGVKVLSRGLKNFVLSDDTSMDEAMAAARSETDRESTAHQLDAFHKTFSFCMSCRQYTCPNCWNEVEARCQSCAPLPEVEVAAPEVAPPVFPGLPALAGPSANGSNGQYHDVPAAEPAAKASGQTAGLLSRFRPGQNLDDELAAFEREQTDLAVEPEAASEAEAIAQPEATVEAEAIEAEAIVEVEAAPEPEAAVQPEAVETELVAAQAAAVPAATEEVAVDAPSDAVEVAAGALANEPVVAQDVAPEDIAPEAVLVEGIAEAAEGIAEVSPEPVEAAAVETQPAAPPADVVEQPTWRITAPDVDAPPVGAPVRPAEPVAPQPTVPSISGPEPQWPVRPEWPAAQASTGLPFLGRPAQPKGGIDSLWAASNRELVATPPAAGRTTSGIQPCISCGLSLSANARFCRRCGTLQGG